jgi:hypothetical protein
MHTVVRGPLHRCQRLIAHSVNLGTAASSDKQPMHIQLCASFVTGWWHPAWPQGLDSASTWIWTIFIDIFNFNLPASVYIDDLDWSIV